MRTTIAPSNGQATTDAIWTYDQDGRMGVLSRVDGAAGGNTTDFIRTYEYDDLLRPYRVTTSIASQDAVQATGMRTFAVEYGYDQNYGRQKAIRYPRVTGSGEAVALDYSPTVDWTATTVARGGGHLVGESELLPNLTRGKRYRRATSMSPRGKVQDQVFGNCATETSS